MTLSEKFPAGMKVFQIPLQWFRKVTAWINNFCGGPGIRMTRPSFPKESAPVEISIDEEWLDERIRGAAGAYTAGNGVTISQAKQVSAKVKANGGVKVDSDGLQIDPDHLGEGTGADATPADGSAPAETTDAMSDTGVSPAFSLDQTAWAADSTMAPLSVMVVSRFYNPANHGANTPYRYLVCRTLSISPNGRVMALSAENAVYKVRT